MKVKFIFLIGLTIFHGAMTFAAERAAGEPQKPAATATISSRIEEQGKLNMIKVTDLRATRRDNLLRIQAEVSNVDNSNQQLYYRFKWLDQDGFSVWDDEPWKPLIIYGGQKKLINVVAPTFKATDFKLVLQSPDNSGL